MTRMILTMGAIVAVGILFVVLPTMASIYLRLRGKRMVRCPDALELAEIQVDAKRAAFTAAVGRPKIRLDACSLWPAYKGCAQECVHLFE